MRSGLTGEEALAYRVDAARRVAVSFKAGVPVAVVTTIAIGAVAHLMTPPGTYALAGCLIGAALILMGRGLVGLPWIAPRPSLVPITVGLYYALLVAHVAACTGGFESLVGALLLHVLIFDGIVVCMSPRDFVVSAVPTAGASIAVIALEARRPGTPWWYLTLSLVGGALVAVAAVLRDRAQQRRFLLARQLAETHRKLAENQAALAGLNAELEGKVRAQVGEILERSQVLEALNAQLRAQVTERSRELDGALARIGRHGGPALSTGMILGGRARIVSFLGAGGMGEVYAADDLLTGARVAVKTARARRATDTADLQRFVAEARALAAVSHPAVVRILHVDVDEHAGLYQIMELVEGETLEARLRRGPLPPDDALRFLGTVAAALAAVHRAGVVHRDVKPANIMLGPAPPGVRLLDFGLAVLPAPMAVRATVVGVAIGTPRYMSPERLEGGEVTAAADVYALGVMLRDLVPAPAPALAALFARMVDDQPQDRPSAEDVAASLVGELHCGHVPRPSARAWPSRPA